MAGLGINWQKQKALMGLRGRLTIRQYSKEPGRLLNLVISALLVLPVVLGATLGTGAAYWLLPEPWPAQVLAITLVVLWLIWFTLPIFSFSVNEGLDPTRLIQYPLSRRDFVATLFLGTLFDYPTYFMLPIFAAALITWGIRFTLVLPVLLVALVLCYFLMILTSQLVVNLIGGLLQSRRFRDVMIIALSLLGSSCWLISQACNRITMRFTEAISPDQAEQFAQTMSEFRPLDLLQWLPPGAAAKAVEQAAAGEWGGVILWLGYATAWVLLLAWVWWRVLQRIVTGEGFLINLPAVPVWAEKKERGRGIDGWLAWLPSDLGEMMIKEIKAIWRTPQRRVGLLQGILMPVFLVIIFAVQDRPAEMPATFSRISGAFLIVYALFAFWANGQNMIGMEATGLSALLLTSVPRQRLLLGKSLGLFVVGGLPLILFGLILTVAQSDPTILLLIPTALGVGLVVQGVMSLTSVFVAFPAPFDRKTGQNNLSRGGGCLGALFSVLVVPTIIGVVSLPAAAPAAIGLFNGQPWLVFVGAAFAVIYGPAMLWLGCYLGGQALLKREPELLQATRPPGAN